jgi:hypothetical protein
MWMSLERASELSELLFWKFSVYEFSCWKNIKREYPLISIRLTISRHNEIRVIGASVNSFSRLCPIVSLKATGPLLRHSRPPPPAAVPIVHSEPFYPMFFLFGQKRLSWATISFPISVILYTHSGIPLPHSSNFGLLFYREDGGRTFLLNFGIHLPDYTMPQPKRAGNLSPNSLF